MRQGKVNRVGLAGSLWAKVAAAVMGGAMIVAPAMGQAATTRPVEINITTNVIVPQVRVVPPGGQAPQQSVGLAAVDATARVNEQVASTTIRLTLRNPTGRVQEAQILMPVPDGATVRNMELEGLGEQGIAQILPRAEARRIYDDIVRRSLDPALLEFAGYNLIKTSVFPVPPHGEQKVNLTYEQILPADGDRVDYVLPKSESLLTGGVAWTFQIDIRGSRPISTLYSPSHDLVIERISESHVLAKVPSSMASEPGSFRISYLHQKGSSLTASLLAYPDAEVGDGQGGYFMLLAGLPVEKPERAQQVKREVILVIDRSGSMRGEKMDQAREAALQVIEGLSPGEAFNIVDYSDTIEVFAEQPVIKTEESMKQARAYLKTLTASGGTNIRDALLEALRMEPTKGMLPMVLFLTDGLATIGERSEVKIRESVAAANTHKRRIFTFGVGYDVNTPLLSHIADGSRATTTFVLPDEDMEVKVGQVFRRLSGPVLSEPVLTFVDEKGQPTTRAVRELMPGRLPDLFEGDQLVLLGQYMRSDPLRVRVTGDWYGQQRTFEYVLGVDKATNRHSFVPRLWAARKIGTLIDEIRQAGANGALPTVNQPQGPDARIKELVDEIVRLSTKWGILTEYTAFLATEPTPAELARIRELTRSGSGQVALGIAPARAAGEAQERLSLRAEVDRAGMGAVSQEQNLTGMKGAQVLNRKNVYWTADMKQTETFNVCQITDRTMFNRAGKWVDSRLLTREEIKPDETVEFGTESFDELLTKLIAQNRQAMLALGGELYLWDDGRCLLVRGPDVAGIRE